MYVASKDVFSKYSVTHLNRENLDRAPLLGFFGEEQNRVRGCFKFQNMWVKHHDFLSIVRN